LAVGIVKSISKVPFYDIHARSVSGTTGGRVISSKLTYRKAGVNIELADSVKEEMSKFVSRGDSRILNQFGAFASLFEAKFQGIRHPVLVLKAEEPGSKQWLALKFKRIRGIGYDTINHLINDIIVMGATPVAILDTIICGKLEKRLVVEIVKSMSEACEEQGCSLVGGETSEQPGVLADGIYVLCASGIGVVDKPGIIDGSRIQIGDHVIGLASNGPHTNGYTLIRKIIAKDESIIDTRVGSETFLNAILRPHKCYYKCLKRLFSMAELHGLAHITGGGIEGNLGRILPEGLSARVDLCNIQILPVFEAIRSAGNVSDSEMMRTFNMGVGMALIVRPSAVEKIRKHLLEEECDSFVIGKITKGHQSVEFKGKLNWQLSAR
jgi:phosphoribosylformylglycinamidine cyclo-ligase